MDERATLDDPGSGEERADQRTEGGPTRAWSLAFGTLFGGLTTMLLLPISGHAVLIGLAAGVVSALALGFRSPPAAHQARGGPPMVGSGERRRVLRLLGMGVLGGTPMARTVSLLQATDGDPFEAGAAAGPLAATSRHGRVRQWTMIIDLRRCDGCQANGTSPQCTMACIEGHLVPEPMEWIEVFETELAAGGTQFVPVPCQHCQNPPCVNVCPVGATFSSPSGEVLIDQDRCIGCRMCMAACPYDRRFFNWGDPPVPPEALLAHHSPEHQVPAQRGTVMKCDFCPDLARGGTLPMCASACPNQAIYYGDLEEDIATNGRQMVTASGFLSLNHAYRLKEYLGTEPRVYYIPGHGEAVGRDPHDTGRLETEWPWVERAGGASPWTR